MNATWILVLLVGAATVAIKGAGPVLFGGKQLPRRFADIVALLAPALLAALVATQSLGAGRSLVLDSRLVGVAAAGLALWRKAPVLLVIVIAAGSTAACRALL